MRLSVLAAVGSAVLLSACVRHYALPHDAPKAVLNVSTTMNGVKVQVFDDDRCTPNPRGNRLAYFFMGVGDPLTGVDKEIPASKEFIHTYAFSAYYYVGASSCNVTVGFKPIAGERYRSTFTAQGGQCVAAVHRVVKSGSGERLIPEESLRQIKPACVNMLTD